jgi:hypothetical protein
MFDFIKNLFKKTESEEIKQDTTPRQPETWNNKKQKTVPLDKTKKRTN